MGVDPKKCTIDFSNIGVDTNSSGHHFFTVTARNAAGEPLRTGGDPFGVKMIHTEGGEVSVDLVDHKNGTYSGVFSTGIEAGSYYIVVGILHPNGRVIQDMVRGSPFTVWVGPKPVEIPKKPAHVHHCYLQGTNYKQALAKHKSCFTIIAADADKNKLSYGGETFKSKIYAPAGSKLPTVPSTIQDVQDGTYIVSYTPVVPGVHRVEVTLNDTPLPGTPFNVDAISGTPDDEVDGQQTQVLFSPGPSKDKGYHYAVIIPKNSKGVVVNHSAQFKSKVLSPERIEVKSWILDNGDSTYTVRFKPELEGIYSISLDLASLEPIKGSPWKAEVKANGVDYEIVSVVPSEAKPKSQVDSVRGSRERSNSAPARPVEYLPNIVPSAVAEIAPPKSPTHLPSLPQFAASSKSPAGSPNLGRPKSGNYTKPTSSSSTPNSPAVGSPIFPKAGPVAPASSAAVRIPPKNPPKNPPPGTKWSFPSKPQPQ